MDLEYNNNIILYRKKNKNPNSVIWTFYCRYKPLSFIGWKVTIAGNLILRHKYTCIFILFIILKKKL